MRINKKQFNKWIKALRSGKFKQAKRDLQNAKGYCCLGVACEIVIPVKKQRKNRFLVGTLPFEQPNSPKWLNTINDDFERMMGKGLTALNDDGTIETEFKSFKFDEIADLLELVYVHKAVK